LKSLISEVDAAIENCIHKKKVLNEELSNIGNSRRALCVTLEERGKKELLKLQQKWKKDERKRLLQLAKQKTIELKKQAAKALEPELRGIIQGHKDDLQRKRDDIELGLKAMKEQVKLECTEKYAKLKRGIQAEERELLQQTDDDYEQRIKDLTSEHEEMMTETHNRLQEERKATEAVQRGIIQEKEDLLKAQVNDIEVQNRKKISEAEKTIKSELLQLQNKVDEEIKKAKKRHEE